MGNMHTTSDTSTGNNTHTLLYTDVFVSVDWYTYMATTYMTSNGSMEINLTSSCICEVLRRVGCVDRWHEPSTVNNHNVDILIEKA